MNSMANERTIKAGSSNANYWHKFGATNGDSYLTVGNDSILGVRDGAIRFSSVVSSKTIVRATVQIVIGNKGSGSGHLKFSVYGIDEDNTSSFGSDPMGRSQTSQHSDIDVVMGSLSSGQNYAVDITSVMQAILGRSGWSSGNAVGLFIRNNSADSDAWITSGPGAAVSASSLDSLTIQENSNPNFTPDPVLVSAPIFPTPRGSGIKIAYPGTDVKSAPRSDLFFTTDERLHKILFQGKITTVANTEYQIPHGLSYIPLAMAFVKSTATSKRFKLPRYFPPYQTDPDADNLQGSIEIDATNVKIITTLDAEVYYYIFLDELST